MHGHWMLHASSRLLELDSTLASGSVAVCTEAAMQPFVSCSDMNTTGSCRPHRRYSRRMAQQQYGLEAGRQKRYAPSDSHAPGSPATANAAQRQTSETAPLQKKHLTPYERNRWFCNGINKFNSALRSVVPCRREMGYPPSYDDPYPPPARERG